MLCWIYALLIVAASTPNKPTPNKPHIVVIVSDDLGWSDVGFTQKTFNEATPESPVLDGLAKEGRILENLYVQSLCTPTRAALMTGRYPHTLGTLYPYFVILGHHAGLNLENKLLPEYLKERGYSTHAVGKWHLGAHERYRPTERGFDTFYGCYGGMVDHLTHSTVRHKKVDGVYIQQVLGSDWHKDYTEYSECPDGVHHFTNAATEANGTHSTELVTKESVRKIASHSLTEPMFLYVAYTAPHSALTPDVELVRTRNSHIKDPAARRYAAMVTQMDNGVGEIVGALKKRDMWDNTFLFFMSDHGACTVAGCWDNVGGNNLPWRGGKFTLFEGGLKSAAFVHGPWMSHASNIKGLMHVTDILPTLLAIADIADQTCDKDCSLSASDIDGVDMSAMLVGEGTGTLAASDIDGVDMSAMLLGEGTGRESIVLNLARGPIPANEKYRWCDDCTKDCPTLPERYAGLRYNNYKLLEGHGEWCSSPLIVSCPPLTPYNNTTVMLFDLESDPEELVNIAGDHPDVVEKMMGLVREAEKKAVTNLL